MKKIILVALIGLFTSTTLSTQALAKTEKEEKTLTFKVAMDCQNCVNKIQDNISYEKGVKDLKVSLDNNECVIRFGTDQTDPEKIIKAFNKIGYKAEVKTEKKSDVPLEESRDGHMQNKEH
ncbi:MAG: heavy-metal-associated domain-containing protein [Prolixibacteraceae bacterium]